MWSFEHESTNEERRILDDIVGKQISRRASQARRACEPPGSPPPGQAVGGLGRSCLFDGASSRMILEADHNRGARARRHGTPSLATTCFSRVDIAAKTEASAIDPNQHELADLLGVGCDIADAQDDDDMEEAPSPVVVRRTHRPSRPAPPSRPPQPMRMDQLPSYVRCVEGRTVVSHDAWLALQEHCDDLKFVNYDTVDFESLGVRVEQDRTLGKGGHVWDGSFVLAEALQSVPTDFAGTVLELGAGATGLAGLSLAARCPRATVLLTDGDVRLLPLLRRNIARNRATNVTARHLAWPGDGDDYWRPAPSVNADDLGAFDLVLAAECVAPIYDPHALVAALLRHSHDRTEIRLLGKDGRWPEHAARVYDILQASFVLVHLGQPASKLRAPYYRLAVMQRRQIK